MGISRRTLNLNTCTPRVNLCTPRVRRRFTTNSAGQLVRVVAVRHAEMSAIAVKSLSTVVHTSVRPTRTVDVVCDAMVVVEERVGVHTRPPAAEISQYASYRPPSLATSV